MGIWKYKEVTGYWVYVIKTPDNMYYVGFSGEKKCSDRWKPSHYNRKFSLKKYIEKYEWDDFQKMVITDGLTKEQALYWEDKLICMYRRLGCCINDIRSGWISKDKTQYRKCWDDTHKEQRTMYGKKYRNKHKNTTEFKIYNRVQAYNHYHPTKIIETALEAKNKYLEFGYIPNYIKTDDL